TSRSECPSERKQRALARVSRSIRGGRPQRPPSHSIRSRAAEMRSLMARRSILEAQAITARMISAAGPFRSNPSVREITSQPVAPQLRRWSAPLAAQRSVGDPLVDRVDAEAVVPRGLDPRAPVAGLVLALGAELAQLAQRRGRHLLERAETVL